MKTLITGGAGFIGSHIVDELIKQGHHVAIIDNLSAGKRENFAEHEGKSNFVFYEKDITDDLTDVFGIEQPEVVFHLAAIPRVQRSIQEPRETHHVNVNGTYNLLQLARHYKVKRFIFSSSSSVYGNQNTLPLVETMKPNPMSPYALHKLIGEEYCRLFYDLYGLETVSLRYFNVYGPRLNPDGEYACLIPKFVKLLNQQKSPIINGDGEQTRDFTHVSDVVQANITAATSRNVKIFGQAFNVGANNNISVNYVTQQIKKILKSDIEPIYGPAVIEPRDTYASIDKSRSLLLWEPKMSFNDGLIKMLNQKR